jgi:hypothetical protein
MVFFLGLRNRHEKGNQHSVEAERRDPVASWKRVKGKTEQVSGFHPKQSDHILKTAAKLNPKLHALILLMRYSGLAILDASTLERSNIVQKNGDFRIHLPSRRKTSKHRIRQSIDNATTVINFSEDNNISVKMEPAQVASRLWTADKA